MLEIKLFTHIEIEREGEKGERKKQKQADNKLMLS